MKDNEFMSVQAWLPFESFLENGIIKLNNNSYIKIVKVIPINYNLKSNMEKEAILNSYKTFLKTCNFDIQILIQSNKEDLSKHIFEINEHIKTENNSNIPVIAKKYVEYIKRINKEKTSSSKNFYIVIKNVNKDSKPQNDFEQKIEIITEELNDKYFKIKECLARCGNIVVDYQNKEEVIKTVYSFLNSRMYLENINY